MCVDNTRMVSLEVFLFVPNTILVDNTLKYIAWCSPWKHTLVDIFLQLNEVRIQ